MFTMLFTWNDEVSILVSIYCMKFALLDTLSSTYADYIYTEIFEFEALKKDTQ